MEHKWKRHIGYYKPYRLLFYSDMFFAMMGSGITLVIPLIVRYITGTVIYLERQQMQTQVAKLAFYDL